MDRKWWTLIAVCTGVFMLLLDVTIVNVALPQIETAFKASLSDLQWVIDAYALTLAALLLTAGSIADLAGRRRVFAIGIVIFTLGSALCGVAQSSVFLSLARALQGVGGAIMFATALALLAQAFPPRERGVAFAVFGAVTGVAVAVGPVLGGAITSGLSWRWIFFVNVPIGIGGPGHHADSRRRVAPAGSAAARCAWLCHVQPRARRARVRIDSQPGRGLGFVPGTRPPDRGGRAAGRVCRDRAARASSRCSTSSCCASPPSMAAWSPPGPYRPRSSRCSPIW